MVAVTDTSPDATPAPAAVDGDAAAPARNIGVVPTASLLTGAAIATVWFWIPLTILIIGISSIPSGIGFALSVVVFVYLMRGVAWFERLRSEAVFGIGYSACRHDKIRPTTGFSAGSHQLWLDITSARFWKGCTHTFSSDGLRPCGRRYRVASCSRSRLLAPAAAIAVSRSDDAAGLSFPPSLAWPLAVVALAVAAAIVVFAPIVDADRPLAALAVADCRCCNTR